MGYTSGTAMDDRGLRDIERWRDKIEVHLDNRQVFFLFFGSALVACMLFVLGVIVGKRLESRGRAVSPEIEDPLALLDKVATSPRPSQSPVTFPQALFGTSGKNGLADKQSVKKPQASAPAAAEAANGKAVALATPAAKVSEPIPPPVALAEPEKVKTEDVKKTALELSEKTEQTENSDKTDKSAVKPEEKTGVKIAAKTAPEPAAEKRDSKTAEAKTVPPSEAKPVVIPVVAASSESKGKSRFALQLSSFQDKSEAEAFAQKFKNEKPYMVMSDIPGKGIWYRVRVGDYPSAKDALTAKQAFERKHNVIAYVAQR